MGYTREEVYGSTLEYFGGDELAARVFIDKYCLKDNENNYLELTPEDMHRRMAREFARMESKNSGVYTEEDFYGYMKDFKYIVPQGSVMSGLGNDYAITSLSNCTVIDPPEDNISSIMETGMHMANLFKRRAGVGTDLSNLRPDGASVNNSAKTSTGAWSFANYYSEITKTIGQKNRRGALMISLDVRHPDIFKFVSMKKDLSKVTGANISVKIRDDFMKAVVSDSEYTLQWPVDGEPKYSSTIKAKDLWNHIVETATETAEPGILFWDTHINNNPSSEYPQYKPVSVNPCGELPLGRKNSCRLISVNFKHFVEDPFSEGARFDFEKFDETVRCAVHVNDNLVDLEIEKIDQILAKTKDKDPQEYNLWLRFKQMGEETRSMGLGTHGLADMLARMNLRYGSEDSVRFIGELYERYRNVAYLESIRLAKVLDGPKFHTEHGNEYIERFPEHIKKEMESGRRNLTILTCAPTGSVSILSQTSSGIEPVFRNSYRRRRKLTSKEESKSGEVFVTEDGEIFEEYDVFHKNVQEYQSQHNDNELPEHFVTSNQIFWKERVDVQAAIQASLGASISSTIALPKGTSHEVVGDIYLYAWESGLKGVTVYVDGSREGILVEKDGEGGPEAAHHYHTPEQRPDVLECDIHHTSVQGEDWVIFVGLMDDKPYEIFGGPSKYVKIPKKYKSGHIKKKNWKTKPNRYDLVLNLDDEEEEMVILDVVKIFDNQTHGVLGRLISLSLRHGARPAYVSEQLFKDSEFDFFTYSKVIGRILKKYIEDGEKPESEEACPECGSELVYEEGCPRCYSCGFSRCS